MAPLSVVVSAAGDPQPLNGQRPARNCEPLSFRFEFEGSKVVFDMVSRDGRLAHIERQERNHHNGRSAVMVAATHD